MTSPTVEKGTSTFARTVVDVSPTVRWLVVLSILQVVVVVAVAFMATSGG